MAMSTSERASRAARAKNILVGQKNRQEYLKHPNLCKSCNHPILPKEGKKLQQTKRQKFCNKSCAAHFNNLGKNYNPRGVDRKQVRTISCKNCGIIFQCSSNKRRYCDKCGPEYQLNRALEEKAKSEVSRTSIQSHAQGNILGTKTCRICGYSIFVEVCHIKSVSSFPGDSLVSEINHPSNLIYLCPNHHKELDRRLLQLEGISGETEGQMVAARTRGGVGSRC